jgi:ribosome-associated translation inhibitor RaiA
MAREANSNDHDLRIEVDRGGVFLSPTDWARMESDLNLLRRLIRPFPKSELKIEFSPHRGSVRVGTTLWLAGETLYAADEDASLHVAWEACVHALEREVGKYKDRLSNKPAYTKQQEGTQQKITPTMLPDPKAIDAAVAELDYPTFRQVMGSYEESVESRVGQRIERYPQAEQMLGTQFTLRDLVESVFLNAFEQYSARPAVPLGAWLEDLIDQSIRAMLAHPDEEQENARQAETAVDAGIAQPPPVPKVEDLAPSPDVRIA